MKFILELGPTPSHYNRERVPNRLYLNSDLNIDLLYDRYQKEAKPLGLGVGLTKFRTIVRKKMKISFANEKDGCEDCQEWKLHANDCETAKSLKESITKGQVLETDTSQCALCSRYQKHKVLYDLARIKHREDGAATKMPGGPLVFSVDMAKVQLLPRIPG